MPFENSSLLTNFNQALKLFQSGQHNEAKILLEKILGQQSNHFPSLFLLGTIFAQIKNYQNAIKFLKHSIKMYQNYAEAHINLGNVY